MNEKIFYEEKKHLDITCNKIFEVIEDTRMDLETMPKRVSDEYVLNELMKRTSLRFFNLQKCIEKPYFARIDFKEDKALNTDFCYLSKVGIADYDGNLVTVDWRAPVASLYYDSNVGEVEYSAPNGIISGYLSLKRQFTIEDKALLEYFDVDIVSDDELLKPYLGVNSDNRLKNIVASIQKEQNKIIRWNLYDNLIIQGVAGSGKTTVALHRIAYLVYNYRDKYKSNQFMVIGPNKYFLSYISSVLPDLDVDNVNQLTFSEIALNYINENFKITISKIDETQKFKCSLAFKDLIEKFFLEFEKNILPKGNFKIKGFTILHHDEISKLYESENITCYDNIQSKIDKLILFLSRLIEDRFEELNSKLDMEFNPLNSDNVREVYKTREYIRQELSKGCKISLKKHFLISDFKSFQIYKEFIENIHKFIKDEDIDIDKLKMNTLFNLENKAVEFEDLSSLMYIKYRLIGAKEYTKYRQVVVDEAQDLGAFHFFILKLMMKDASFSIFGDLAQAIYPYRSIENWDEVISVLKDKCHFLKLNKSYRTTIEIMHKANLIIEHIGLDIAEPVIRHGKDVEIFKIKNKDILNKIKDTIEDMQNEGHKTIAIITKTLKEADEICKKLSKMNILIHNIEKENEEFESGVCILTSFMAKGLEFDGVIITNASESNYKNDNILDMKLLYVSITRSLHRLVLLHDDDITKIFKNLGNH